jgi:ribonuclease P protein component
MTHPNSFSKAEHLCGEIRTTRLFTSGEAFIAYPLRVVYQFQPKTDDPPALVLMGVPKKRFKRAVKRNRLKRLMREAYRLNKQLLVEKLTENGKQIHIAFNYVSDEELDFATIEMKMKIALSRIIEKVEL